MKKFTLFLLFLACLSCGSYNSIDSFYNSHKNDANVTAFQVPHFMLSLLRGSSTDMDSFLATVRDIRYIKLSPKTAGEKAVIADQIGNLTTNRSVEIYRKNEDEKRTLISVREARDVVKEIVIATNNQNGNSIFYFNGNFDPVKVRNYAKNNEFDKLTGSILQQSNIAPEKTEN